MSSIWEEHALHMLRRFGFEEARLRARASISRSSPGTASHAFAVATLKFIEKHREEEERK